ncbi:class II histocompatibility antigen, B-L beta chain-like [Pipra filicauda]|uniref:Class II histocompatibility antigen, B-L beta chain-like n=1 Tax=Pipra filicauda TaxID=649802 RepID=A0A7R5L945_9PASS|nr:class II histocompatibility antigen, B-L beta chain-like [Pipra filicauda]
MAKCECYFINGTEQVRFVQRFVYNREQFIHFDSDVGSLWGTPRMGRCWPVPPSVSISLVPSSSQPGPGRLLCSVMDFYPAPVQVRWFQDGQELPEHVVATDVVPNGDWSYQVLVLLEIPPRRGVTYSCQVEHVSLEHPLSRHWEMSPDTVHSKILVGVGGFVLGLVFLALGLGFYLWEKPTDPPEPPSPGAAAGAPNGVFQLMTKSECYFINGTERVRLVKRYIYNREQYARLEIDLGTYVEDTLFGEKVAREWNHLPEWRELKWSEMERFCRHNYEFSTTLLVNRRVPPSVSISLVPSSSQPSPGRLLCSGMDFYPAPVQVRWFQDGQELPEHVVATDVVPNGDWSCQVLVLLEIPPRRGVTYSCQVEHVSLEHPLSRHWEMPPDTVRSKILVGVGGFVLGLVFLALGLGFYLREKSS